MRRATSQACSASPSWGEMTNATTAAVTARGKVQRIQRGTHEGIGPIPSLGATIRRCCRDSVSSG